MTVPDTVCPVFVSESSSDTEVVLNYKKLGAYLAQADVVQDDTSSSASDVRAGITTFVENKEIPDTGLDSRKVLGNVSTDTYIKDFLARPVRVLSFEWDEADVVGNRASFAIWNDWSNRVSIKNKLANYAFMRADLRIKVQISCSPFYYGMLQMSYLPIPFLKPSTIVLDASNLWLTPMSQRPHVNIDPSQGDTFEFTAPFIYPYNMVNLNSAVNLSDLGTLRFDVYSPLKSANGVSTAGVTVVAYCWLENVELSGATVGLTLQSDEYGVGVVSKPASWVADFATHFEDLPIIGRFATATRLGASAISGIASLFGFTNVPVVSDTEPMRPECFPKMASPEISFPIEKLGLDPKNELSIDPAIVGLPTSVDEMTIASIVQRESYLTRSVWSTADTTDTIKFACLVDPCLCNVGTVTGGTTRYHTPLSFVSNAFTMWRGDIKVILRVIASKYHKGKLRITFDPSGNASSNINSVFSTSNVVQNAIMDIGETREVEFNLPYQQLAQFMRVSGNSSNFTTASPVSFSRDTNFDNGYFTVRVQNVLTAPVASSTVDILIYIKGGDNFEYAVPDDIDFDHTASYFAPQSDIYISEPVNGVINMGDVSQNTENQYLVHFGENVKSIRQLLHRFSRVGQDVIYPDGTANTYQWWQKRNSHLPQSPGYSPSGYSVANKQVSGTYPYNFVEFTPLTYFANAFLCYRGSINYTFNVAGNIPMKNVTAERIRGPIFVGDTDSSSIVTNGNQLRRAALTGAGSRGLALTNQLTQAGLNVQKPYMSRTKFSGTSPASADQVVAGEEALMLKIELPFPTTTVTDKILVTTYVSTGPDFGLYYFLNCPTLYYYATQPSAA